MNDKQLEKLKEVIAIYDRLTCQYYPYVIPYQDVDNMFTKLKEIVNEEND